MVLKVWWEWSHIIVVIADLLKLSIKLDLGFKNTWFMLHILNAVVYFSILEQFLEKTLRLEENYFKIFKGNMGNLPITK